MNCHNHFRHSQILLLAIASFLIASQRTDAGTIYVNNRLGSDAYNGIQAEAITEQTGPVRTIGRALKLAGRSDVISLANTGVPYYESISLVGSKHSGPAMQPFTILGNGATLSGAMAVPETAWQQVGSDLWRLKPYRKGHYQLILDGKAVSEVKRPAGTTWTEVPEMPPGSWCAFKGAMYFQAERLAEPESMRFGLARHSCGITLYGVNNVVIDNLTIQHFRIDGVNANDHAKDVVLQRVVLTENGRAGLTVAGTSLVAVLQSRIERNREHSILLKEAAALVVVETQLDAEPDQQ
jgi:hypothetical protein